MVLISVYDAELQPPMQPAVTYSIDAQRGVNSARPNAVNTNDSRYPTHFEAKRNLAIACVRLVISCA